MCAYLKQRKATYNDIKATQGGQGDVEKNWSRKKKKKNENELREREKDRGRERGREKELTEGS